MKKLTIAVIVILIFMCTCNSRRDSSTEKPEIVKNTFDQETARSVDDQKDLSPKDVPENVAVETPMSQYTEISRLGSISKYDRIVKKYARRYLFDWRLISAQIYTESRFKHQARSYRGALGLMQIMPGTARWLEGKVEGDISELKGVSEMLVDPEMNIHLGCYYDAMLFSRIKDAKSSDDRQKMMFAAYNAGPGNLSRARKKSNAPDSWEKINRHLPTETRKYVPKIYDKYKVYKQWTALTPY